MIQLQGMSMLVFIAVLTSMCLQLTMNAVSRTVNKILDCNLVTYLSFNLIVMSFCSWLGIKYKESVHVWFLSILSVNLRHILLSIWETTKWKLSVWVSFSVLLGKQGISCFLCFRNRTVKITGFSLQVAIRKKLADLFSRGKWNLPHLI